MFDTLEGMEPHPQTCPGTLDEYDECSLGMTCRLITLRLSIVAVNRPNPNDIARYRSAHQPFGDPGRAGGEALRR